MAQRTVGTRRPGPLWAMPLADRCLCFCEGGAAWGSPVPSSSYQRANWCKHQEEAKIQSTEHGSVGAPCRCHSLAPLLSNHPHRHVAEPIPSPLLPGFALQATSLAWGFFGGNTKQDPSQLSCSLPPQPPASLPLFTQLSVPCPLLPPHCVVLL